MALWTNKKEASLKCHQAFIDFVFWADKSSAEHEILTKNNAKDNRTYIIAHDKFIDLMHAAEIFYQSDLAPLPDKEY